MRTLTGTLARRTEEDYFKIRAPPPTKMRIKRIRHGVSKLAAIGIAVVSWPLFFYLTLLCIRCSMPEPRGEMIHALDAIGSTTNWDTAVRQSSIWHYLNILAAVSIPVSIAASALLGWACYRGKQPQTTSKT